MSACVCMNDAEFKTLTMVLKSHRDKVVLAYRAEIARRHLLGFTEYTYPQYRAEPVHRLIADYLMKVVSGEIDRLMVFTPPQVGKSELVSVRLPAYWLGVHPDWSVILTSYGASLAEHKSRQARDLVDSIEYRHVFPHISTTKSSRAVNAWGIDDHLGSVIAAGVGGGITGHGAHLGILDDPVENWEQAQSQTMRDRVWDWYRSTFRTRIREGGRIVLVMTRWHQDDLAGQLLREGGEDWTVVRLPALAETQEERDENNRYLGLPIGQPDPLGRQPGETLAPLRFSLETMLKTREEVGSIIWSCMYQGVPRAAEGNLFKREWFTKFVDAAPAQAWRVRYWDKAGTEGGGAFSSGVLMAKTAERMFYVEDVVRGQWSALDREAVIRQTAELDRQKHGDSVQIWVEQEGGSGGKESAENTIRNLAGFAVRADHVTGDKVTRSYPFQAQCEAGNVRLVRGPWNYVYIDELTAFPNGRYKDQVDASSGAFNKLALLQVTEAPLPVVETHTFWEEAARAESDEPWTPRMV